MKTLILFISLLVGLYQEPLPEVNQKIVDYCKKNEGKKIDRGECWDLAAFALNDAGATWSTPYNFGTKYDFKKDSILAGDIIQFENVEFKGEYYSMSMPHHTAIVLEVVGDKICKIAHQNFAGKRKIQFTEVNFNDVKKGSLQFYRPVAGSSLNK